MLSLLKRQSNCVDECFVLFRFPSSDKDCRFIRCSEDELLFLNSYEDIGVHEGFVFAPFETGGKQPVVVFPKAKSANIRLEKVNELSLNAICQHAAYGAPLCSEAICRKTYHEDFLKFKSALNDSVVRKVVLSRTESVESNRCVDVANAFHEACQENPNSFVALVSSKATGVWLLATPEVLIEETEGKWHTVALAGTQAYDGNAIRLSVDVSDLWDEKNIREQEYVATYIQKELKPFAAKLMESGPFTVQAGNLMHIRTDFYFDVMPSVVNPLGKIVARLHPTPAVCGFPADASLALIRKAEHCDRQYYSGFCGMVESGRDFHLYVTLRCVRLFSDACTFFAGGGILNESDERKEWDETKMKMLTIKRCIH